MKLITIFLFLILFVTMSCLKRGPASNSQLEIGQSYLLASFEMDEKQQSYAYSFCSALRSFRHQMIMDHLGQQIHYTFSETKCDQGYVEKDVTLKIAQNKLGQLSLIQKNKNIDYHFDLLTDESDEVAVFCQSILSGEQDTNEIATGVRAEFRPLDGSNSLEAIFLFIKTDGVIGTIKRYDVDVNPASVNYGQTLSTLIETSCANSPVIHQKINTFREMN